jgi:hypothetical protein
LEPLPFARYDLLLLLTNGEVEVGFLSRIYFYFYFIWNTETFKNRDPLTIYTYCTVSDTFSIFKTDISRYGRLKTLQVLAIFNSHSFNFDFLEENVFAFLTRFLCPGLRAQLFVCGMVRVPSVEVTDLVATFCFFKP